MIKENLNTLIMGDKNVLKNILTKGKNIKPQSPQEIRYPEPNKRREK